MFTIHCTTCGARLAVKSDELVGQILACPKCGGMVLVERPEDELIDLALREEPVLTRFPDPAIAETDSGIMKPEEMERFVTPPPPPPVLTESEIRTRKILLGTLLALLLLLVLAVGVLFTGGGNRTGNGEPTDQAEKPAEEFVPTIVKPEKKTQKPSEPEDSPPAVNHEPEKPAASSTPPALKANENEKRDLLSNLLSATPEPVETPTVDEEKPSVEEPKEIRSTTDVLASLERKMPGLLNPTEAVSIDIPARLARSVSELKLVDTPLFAAMRTFAAMTEIPMTLDVDEFRCRGIRVDAPLTVDLKDMSAGNMLTKLLEPLELEPVVAERQISVTVSDERKNRLQERTFDVDDLVEFSKDAVDLHGQPDAPLTAEMLADRIRRLVDPVGFGREEPTGEQPALRVDGNTLIARHRLRMLDEVLRLLEQLRVLRGIAQTTEVTGEHLAPEAFGWDAVMAPMTLNYYQPTPLAGVLKQLETATKLRILVDHRALHIALCPLASMKATVRCNRGTVNEALENLLASIDVAQLTYRIVDFDVLEITTGHAARQSEKMSIEVHRYETPEKLSAEPPEELVRTLRTALEPGSWFDPANPDGIGLGDVIIDRPSGCLIVRQSQPVQRQLRLWLGKRLSTVEPEDDSPERSVAQ